MADVLGLPTSRILSWTRSGLLTPTRSSSGAYVYSFQDIVLLRTARELLDEHVPLRRVRAALEALREQLPVGRPLSAVHISAVGDRVFVRDEDAMWEPDSGQIRIDFPVAPVAERAEPIARRALEAPREPGSAPDDMGADDWYDTAVDLEAVAPDRAAEAYRRALALDPRLADALLNLGRLLHEVGDLTGAEERYRAATDASPESGRAHYNLGVVLEDTGRGDRAVEEYRRAIALEPELAAAHYNLSRLLHAAGERTDALRHLTEYRRIVTRGDTGS